MKDKRTLKQLAIERKNKYGGEIEISYQKATSLLNSNSPNLPKLGHEKVIGSINTEKFNAIIWLRNNSGRYFIEITETL